MPLTEETRRGEHGSSCVISLCSSLLLHRLLSIRHGEASVGNSDVLSIVLSSSEKYVNATK
jgi:hypothetical protein